MQKLGTPKIRDSWPFPTRRLLTSWAHFARAKWMWLCHVKLHAWILMGILSLIHFVADLCVGVILSLCCRETWAAPEHPKTIHMTKSTEEQSSRRMLCRRTVFMYSAVPKRGRSKPCRSQKHANARKRAQMSANACKRKSAKERKRAQKSAKGRQRAPKSAKERKRAQKRAKERKRAQKSATERKRA